MKEEWKTLVYYKTKDTQPTIFENFEISNTGKLRNAKTKKEYSLYINHTGYYQIYLTNGSKKDYHVFKIHRAVACTFIPNDNYKLIVNHKDGNKLNNSIDNLEWVTYAENSHHAITHGLSDNSHLKYYSDLQKKPVDQINIENGEIINTFPSIADAGKNTGIDTCHIAAVCAQTGKTKRKTAGGYIWRYHEAE